MFGFDKFNISFEVSPIIVGLALLLAIFISVWFYKYSIPQLAKKWKYTVILLRFLSLATVIILVTNPKINLTKINFDNPLNQVFIDNSFSIINSDSIHTKNWISNFINNLLKYDKYETEIFTFSDSLNQLNLENEEIEFHGRKTNIQSIFTKINENKNNVENTFLITDGNINDGKLSIEDFSKINSRLTIVACGNKVVKSNIEILNVLMNNYFYDNIQNPINVRVLNDAKIENNISISLIIDGIVLKTKQIKFLPNEIKEIPFSYKPNTIGKHVIEIKIANIENEQNILDNIYYNEVIILKGKKQIGILTSSPNFDFRFLKESLETDSNFVVKPISVLSKYEQFSTKQLNTIKNCDLLFLINFPTDNIDANTLSKVKTSIKNKPLFIQFTNELNFKKLNYLQPDFKYSQHSVYQNVQISKIEIHPILEGISSNKFEIFYNYPPVNLFAFLKQINFGKDIVSANIDNKYFPIFAFNADSENKQINFYASDFWKWKLQTDKSNSIYFDILFNNIAKWLTTENSKGRLKINLTKKIFAENETVNGYVSIVNQILNPTNDYKISGNIKGNNFDSILDFENIGNGIYNFDFQNLSSGNYDISVLAKSAFDSLRVTKNIKIAEIEMEKKNQLINYEYLDKVKKVANGNLFNLENIKLNDILNENPKQHKRVETKMISIFPKEILLIFIIFVLSFEWFIRKRKGLI